MPLQSPGFVPTRVVEHQHHRFFFCGGTSAIVSRKGFEYVGVAVRYDQLTQLAGFRESPAGFNRVLEMVCAATRD